MSISSTGHGYGLDLVMFAFGCPEFAIFNRFSTSWIGAVARQAASIASSRKLENKYQQHLGYCP